MPATEPTRTPTYPPSPPLWAKAGSGRRNDLDNETYIPEVSKALNAHPGGARRQDAESETFVADVAGTLNANGKAAGSATQQDSESGMPVAHTLKGEGHDASEDGTGRGVPVIPILEVGKGTSSHGAGPNGCWIGKVGDPMFTLQANAQHAISVGLGSDPLHADELAQPVTNRNGDPGVIAFSSKDHGADAGEIAPTLRSMGHDKSHPNAGGQIAVAMQEGQTGCREYDTAGSLRANGPGHDPVGTRVRTGMRVRRLTPRECERLQGFPDDYTLVTFRKKPAADGPRYKAIGNSMPIPVMEWIGRRISECQTG